MKQLKNLKITNSKIPESGLGLFNARKSIPKDVVITNDTGVESTQSIHGNYVLQVNKKKWIKQIVQLTLEDLQMIVGIF